MNQASNTTDTLKKERTKRYIIYLVLFMGMIAIMDQYLSFIETTAIPNVLRDYAVTDSEYSFWKAIYFIPTFLIFLLNAGKKSFKLLIIILALSLPLSHPHPS